MPAINVWLTVVNGVADTTEKDFQRSEKVFVSVPLTFRKKKFTSHPRTRRGPFWAPMASWLSRAVRRSSTIIFRQVLLAASSVR